MWVWGENLKGALMMNDKPRAKLYEKAVREEWPRKKVEEALSLSILKQGGKGA